MSNDLAAADRDALLALLSWQLACGADIAVGGIPIDRYAESAAAPQQPMETKSARAEPPPPRQEPASTAPAPTRAKGAAPLFPEEAARRAGAAAAGAQDLAQLSKRLEDFDGCALKSMARHFLFSAGTAGARLMVLDFAPGEEEERSGVAFTGPAALLLDNMLKAIGLDRETSYLAYFSPWRPPGDLTANAVDEAVLTPFARRHVELAAPQFLLILGEATARIMLKTDLSDAQLRGRWFDCACGERTVSAMVLPRLANVLRTPAMKRNIWRDLQMVAAALREP